MDKNKIDIKTGIHSPLISVLIPVYNVEKYLEECLDSVVGQTLKDIEIVCIDDGSTDGSGRICDVYADKDPRIRVFHKENQGVGLTRNLAIDEAEGEYVCFLDPDDAYPDSHILEKLYKAASENDALIAGGSFSQLNESNGVLQTEFKYPFEGYTFKEEGFIDFDDYQFNYGFHRFLYHRKFLNKNGIRFPDYKRYQDPPFFLNAMLCAGKFYAIPDITYRLRIGHKDHVAMWKDKRKVNDAIRGIAEVLRISAENHLKGLYLIAEGQLKRHTNIFADLIQRQQIENGKLQKDILNIKSEYSRVRAERDKLEIKLRNKKKELIDIKNNHKEFDIKKYIKYKILSKITLGKMRERHKQKYQIQKSIYSSMKEGI